MRDDRQPFALTRKGGVLYLTLDTPRCEVNIFNNAAAAQLRDALATEDFSTTRAVVLQSGKSESFVNGVGLLMAVAAQTPEAARDLSADVRASYQALRDCPVPTIAAVRGNCYGCGVELALACDYRLAANTSVTHFYMTEINDYLFLPIFEGTLRLPLLLGLERSAALLLWGERWSAMQAHRFGLVDAVVDVNEMDASTALFVAKALEQTADKKPPPRPLPDERLSNDTRRALIELERQRIAALPPSYQPIYHRALDLMIRAIAAGRVTARERDDEIMESGRSACNPVAKKALSFFFIRQVAHRLASGDVAVEATPLHLTFDGDSTSLQTLRDELQRQRVPGAFVHAKLDGLSERKGIAAVRVRDHGDGGVTLPPGVDDVAFGVTMRKVPRDGAAGVLFRPFLPSGPPLLELAAGQGSSPVMQRLYRYLTSAGFRVVPSQAAEGSVLVDLLLAYFAPLVRFVQSGGRPSTVSSSLRHFGFSRRPREHLLHIDEGWLESELAALLQCSPSEVRLALRRVGQPEDAAQEMDQGLVDGLCVSLYAAALRSRAGGTLRHPSLVDLAARETVDFPLQHGSLATYMTRERLRSLLGGVERVRPWVCDDDLDQLAKAAERPGAYA